MKKANGMNKIIIMALVVVVALVGFGAMKYCTKGSMFMSNQSNSSDLVVANDSTDTFSTAFTRNGKTMSQVVHPGEKATGGKGLLRIFVAKKNGNYEIQYPFPRPAGKPREISLTQVLHAAHNPEVGQELMTEKGMIDDIRVDYEEVLDMDATY